MGDIYKYLLHVSCVMKRRYGDGRDGGIFDSSQTDFLVFAQSMDAFDRIAECSEHTIPGICSEPGIIDGWRWDAYIGA